MNVEDIIYLSLLFCSMGFGFYYRKIDNVDKKRKTGAAVGFVIILIVSGIHTLHVLISTIVNACIILYTDKRKCQFYTISFSFLYLFFFRSTIYFGIPYPPSHTNLIQMMLTLKLVGLANEVNNRFESKKKKDDAEKTEEQKLEDETLQFKLGFQDIFYYVFNYCGVLTGPYFRYRTFLDHLHKPYYKYDNFRPALKKKLYWLPFLATMHLLNNHFWPLSYVNTEEFLNRSFFYRYWYIWPSFVIFKTRLYIGLILAEIVCIFGGLGVYPAFTKPKSGHGPTQNFKQLKEITEPDDLKKIEYDYETVKSINPYESDTVPTMREAMKHWNITVQYWLASNIYKKFPYKKFRIHATMLTSAVWHGIHPGYYLCIATVPFTLVWENVWVKLLLENNEEHFSKINYCVMLFLKTQMFSYQSMSFVLLEMDKIIRYYNSVYHCIPILYMGLYLLGKRLLTMKERSEKGKVSTD